MKRKPITVGDLPDQIGQPGPRAFLYCDTCGGEYSAHRGDYSFLMPDDHVMRCCRRPMRLMTRESKLVDVEVQS